MVSTEDELLQTFRTATEEKYAGWGARSIRSRVTDKPEKRKPIPFRLSEVLPWWEKVEAVKAASDEKPQD